MTHKTLADCDAVHHGLEDFVRRNVFWQLEKREDDHGVIVRPEATRRAARPVPIAEGLFFLLFVPLRIRRNGYVRVNRTAAGIDGLPSR